MAMLPACTSSVHGVAEADARVGVGEAEGSAGAEVAEGARIGPEWPLFHRQLETQIEAGDPTEHGVVAVDRFGAGALDPFGRKDVQTAVVGGESVVARQRAVETGQRAGVAVPVGGGYFRGAPSATVDDLVAGEAGRVGVRLFLHLGGFGAVAAILAGCGRQDVDDAVVEFRAEADLEVDLAGAAELFAQIRADTVAGDAAQNLADQIAEGVRVIAMGATRFPPRFLFGQGCAEEILVEGAAGRELFAHGGQPGLVGEELTHRDPRFAGLNSGQ